MEERAGEEQSIEARAALLLQLRRAGVRDLSIMRAFETTPRELFAPHRFRDLAARDMSLPIGCGQTMPAAADLARRLEALRLEPHHRVLEVGTGSGFGAAVLSRLAREVVTIERFETLAIEARQRLAELGRGNVEVFFGDGLAANETRGYFDRVILHMSFQEPPYAVLAALALGGTAVFGRFDAPVSENARPGERLFLSHRESEPLWTDSDLGPCRLGAALAGRAKAL
ncbi:protein-L-isoaspartate(D-aspartate) O-methyltransferase [Methylosinus sp. H3A]|uniref:protein-L-isoaspartate O-methyltransferase family protein n=1 Tax=Methylosinus sp. H3A TaxID=2785786 RepID=UPI0018C2E032|nr:methyltransferase domain-containing protein [Methylosinus sp. H3A]MBG0811524.1 protein-L-isoaspartate(D-aspartate) O-methyltransferase [Methylosinus sp. H3A]